MAPSSNRFQTLSSMGLLLSIAIAMPACIDEPEIDNEAPVDKFQITNYSAAGNNTDLQGRWLIVSKEIQIIIDSGVNPNEEYQDIHDGQLRGICDIETTSTSNEYQTNCIFGLAGNIIVSDQTGASADGSVDFIISDNQNMQVSMDYYQDTMATAGYRTTFRATMAMRKIGSISDAFGHLSTTINGDTPTTRELALSYELYASKDTYTQGAVETSAFSQFEFRDALEDLNILITNDTGTLTTPSLTSAAFIIEEQTIVSGSGTDTQLDVTAQYQQASDIGITVSIDF